jgi:hypothetical protein
VLISTTAPPFYIPLTTHEGSNFSTTSPVLAVFYPCDSRGPDTCEAISHGGSGFSLMSSNTEYVFTQLLVRPIFGPFFNWFVSLFATELKELLIHLATQPFTI